MVRAAAAEATAQGAPGGVVKGASGGRSLLQNGSSAGGGNASYADFESADTVNSDLTREGEPDHSFIGVAHLAGEVGRGFGGGGGGGVGQQRRQLVVQ